MRLKQHAPDIETRNAIKSAARRLFAERGIDGVAIREIVALSGQRGGGSIHYHFGSKEALVRELIVDGAKLIDDRRNAALDAIVLRATPPTLRDIIEVLVGPALTLGEDTYLRFINALQMSHREMFLEALDNHWNSGYLRCLSHIRSIVQHVPEKLVAQRLVLMGIYLTTAMAYREASLDNPNGSHPFWRMPYTMENFVDTMESLISGPASPQTLAKLDAAPGRTDPSVRRATRTNRKPGQPKL